MPCIYKIYLSSEDVMPERSPLHVAIIEEQVEVVARLISQGLDVNQETSDYYTPLDLAIETRNLSIIKLLLDAGASVYGKVKNDFNNDGKGTPLFRAVKSNNENIIKMFMNAISNMTAADNRDYSLLHLVAEWGNSKILKILIDSGADLNFKNKGGCTPIYSAIESRNLNILKLLIDAKADVNSESKYKYTPLHKAAEKSKNFDIIKILIEAGANVNAKLEMNGNTPLHNVLDSIRKLDVKVIKLLIESHADVHAANAHGSTPLHLASSNQPVEILMQLLNAKANVNAQDGKKSTPLHRAASRKENIDNIKLLIKSGANINARNFNESTPLHIAIQESRSVDVAKLLLDCGADLNAKDAKGCTPLHKATEWRETDILNFLIDAGANVNAKDNEGCTALHKTVVKLDRLNTTKILLEAGADLNITNIEGKTPFELFNLRCLKLRYVENYTKENLQLLLEYVDINIRDSNGQNLVAVILSGALQLYKTGKKTFYKIILEHIAKLAALNVEIDSSIIEAIESKEDHRRYYTACTQELKKAKSTKLEDCWVTFFNLLVDDQTKLVKYAGNDDLMEDFKNNFKRFPIYKFAMRSNVSDATDGRAAYDSAANNLCHYLPIFNPTHLVIRNTLDILSREDWEVLSNKKRSL